MVAAKRKEAKRKKKEAQKATREVGDPEAETGAGGEAEDSGPCMYTLLAEMTALGYGGPSSKNIE